MAHEAISQLILNLEDPKKIVSYSNILNDLVLMAQLSVYKIQYDQCRAGIKITKSIWGHIGEGGKIYVSGKRQPTDKEFHIPGYPDWYCEANVETLCMGQPNPEQYEEITGEPWVDKSTDENTSGWTIDHDELNDLDNLIICYLKDWNPWGKVSHGDGLHYLMNNDSNIRDIIDLVLQGKSREEIRKIQFPNATR